MLIDRVRSAYYHLPDGFQRAVLVRRRSAIWLNAGIIFVHIPKAAGTSINDALYGRFMGHVRASDIQRWGSQQLRSLPSFAVTRNPWDRLVSAYRFIKRGSGVGGENSGRVWRAEQYRIPEFESFERFVNKWLAPRDLASLDRAFHPQHIYVCDEHGKIIVDHVGRLEDMGPTYEFLHEKLPGLPPIGRSNRSGSPVDYRSFYTARLVDKVGSIYSEDVRLFGYTFD